MFAAAVLVSLPLLIEPTPLMKVLPPPDPAESKLPPQFIAQKREWMLVIAPGFDYIDGLPRFRALGGGFRLGGHAIKWTGERGRVLLGAGPILHYAYLQDPDYDDAIHLVTVNGDLLIGGGNKRWGLYWHLTAGLGYMKAFDAQTNAKLQTLGARGATGVGGFGKINDRVSLGALVDFGWAAGLWVNTSITANVHFGRRGDPL